MRKLLVLFAFVIAGPFTFGGLIPQAVAEQIICIPNSTEKRVNDGFNICWDGCKGEKEKNKHENCHTTCTRVLDACLKQVKEEQKKREAKEDQERQKVSRCRQPVLACGAQCLKETHNDQKKCDEKCAKGKMLDELNACLKR